MRRTCINLRVNLFHRFRKNFFSRKRIKQRSYPVTVISQRPIIFWGKIIIIGGQYVAVHKMIRVVNQITNLIAKRVAWIK